MNRKLIISQIHIGYIPNGEIIGLSKIARITNVFARRLQVQERLTSEIATAIMNVLKPRGVFVVVVAVHLCMAMRGVEQTSSATTTSCALGCFEHESKLCNEFFGLVNMK